MDRSSLTSHQNRSAANDDVLRAIRSGGAAAYVAVVEKLAVSVAGRFPKPDGTSWTSEDVEDLTSEFYSSAAYEHSILNAHDDESLRKLVYTGLVNLVRAKLRRTDRARLQRRLKEVISPEGYVEWPTKFWRRRDDPPSVRAVAASDLLEAAWQVEVEVVKWRPDAKRHSPVAEKSSLLALLDAVYDQAGGAVHIDTLVEVIGQRLGVGPVAAIESLDMADDRYTADWESDPAEQVCEQYRELDAADTANVLWDQLSPRERQLVPHLSSSARQAATAIGGGKSAVNDAMNRLKSKFRTVLRDSGEDDQLMVLSKLLALASVTSDS
ncbi:hypothetical protein [Candidatus Poriferisocius sp.]|uniref:hypothetical protein n=1 Tax=Candidatus Poriferisocius sp. TaxID=3101276 RepID=UPI003B01942C